MEENQDKKHESYRMEVTVSTSHLSFFLGDTSYLMTLEGKLREAQKDVNAFLTDYIQTQKNGEQV